MNINNWKLTFFTIWAGQAVSLITTSVSQYAIIWYLTEKTGSAMVLSMATMVAFLPQAIFGSVIGVYIDRHNRKKIMMGADSFIAAVSAVLAIIALYMAPPIWIIMIALFLRSLGSAFHAPSLSAVTPLIVPEEHLTKCSGYVQAIQSAGFMLGPAAAAFFYSIWSLSAVIAMDIVGAAVGVSTVFLAKIPHIKKQALEQPKLLQEIKDGFYAVHRQKGLYTLLWIGVLFAIAIMPIGALFPLISMNYFGGTFKHASVSEIAFSGGMLLGGLIIGVWGGTRNRAAMIVAAIIATGVTVCASGMLPPTGFTLFVVLCVIMGVATPFYNAIQTAIYQEKLPPEYLGRVFSLVMSLMSLAMPIGLVMSGIFAEAVGINTWFIISGVIIVLIGVLCAMMPSVWAIDAGRRLK